MSARLSLLSNTRAGGGTVLYALPPIDAGRLPIRLDRRGNLDFLASRYLPSGEAAPWWVNAECKQHVIEVVQSGRSVTTEFRLTGMEDGAAGAPTVRVKGEPIVSILRDVGPLREPTVGGGSYYSRGGIDLTPTQYIDEFIIAFLEDYCGITWIARGTVDFTGTHSISWDAWTPLQLMTELERLTGGEFEFERNGTTNYRIHLRTRVGQSAQQAVVSQGRNLVDAVRTRSPEGFATVVQPFGMVPEGSVERATIGLASWKVSAVSSDDVTLVDRAGGDGPVAITDQFVGNFLLATDGTLWEIEATTTAGVFSLETGGGASFTAGDEVEIRKDGDGTLLEELVDPDASQRVVGTFNADDMRGERNYAANPFADTWTTKPSGVYADVNGAHVASATLALDGIVPADKAFKEGDAIAFLNVLDKNVFRVTADATAAAGAVTLSVSPSVTCSNNDQVAIYNLTAPPDGWTDVNDGTSKISIFQYRPSSTSELTGLVNGTTSNRRITLDGLTAGAEIYAGDALQKTGGLATEWAPIVLPATVDGSGNVTVTTAAIQGTPGTFTDNEAIRIVRPSIPASAADSVVTLLCRKQNSGDTGVTGAVLQLPEITVPFLPDRPTLWVRAGFTIRGQGAFNNTSIVAPKLQLWDGSALAEVVADAELTGDLDNDTQVAVHVGYQMTADLTASVRVLGAARNGGGNLFVGDPFTFVRWIAMSLGSDDPSTPPVWGSHATPLWQYGNRRLLAHRQLPTSWSVTARELVDRFGLTPAEAQLVLGGEVRLVCQELSIDDTFRVVEVNYNLVDDGDTSFTLSTRLEDLTTKLDRRLTEIANSVRVANSGARTLTQADIEAPSTAPAAQEILRVRNRVEFLDQATGDSKVKMYRYSPDGIRIEPTAGITKKGATNTGYIVDVQTMHVAARSAPAMHVYMDCDAATTGSPQGVEGYITCSHPSGTVVLTIATIGITELQGAGTITEARGVLGMVFASAEASGVITTANAFRAQVFSTSTAGATIQNARGLFVDDITIGTVTNYAIYTGSGKVRLGDAIESPEISDPAAPAANTALLYARDNGAGKTQWVARFPTGAVQVIATEP